MGVSALVGSMQSQTGSGSPISTKSLISELGYILSRLFSQTMCRQFLRVLQFLVCISMQMYCSVSFSIFLMPTRASIWFQIFLGCCLYPQIQISCALLYIYSSCSRCPTSLFTQVITSNEWLEDRFSLNSPVQQDSSCLIWSPSKRVGSLCSISITKSTLPAADSSKLTDSAVSSMIQIFLQVVCLHTTEAVSVPSLLMSVMVTGEASAFQFSLCLMSLRMISNGTLSFTSVMVPVCLLLEDRDTVSLFNTLWNNSVLLSITSATSTIKLFIPIIFIYLISKYQYPTVFHVCPASTQFRRAQCRQQLSSYV